MTIKIGTEYVHTALGYQDAQGAIVITEDTGLATMTGRYVDNLPTAATNPDAYTWTELADPEDADDTEDDTSDEVEDTSSMLYRMAGTQMTEAIQDNLAVGTNQGASGWETSTGTIAAASCQPDGSAEAVNGVAWAATAGGTLLRTEPIPGEAVPETVTVSFWWLASAACGLTVSIGNNESETQYNHDSTDLDEDGDALDLTDAWLFFRALIPIAQTADDYAVKVATDSAATISICDFKVEPGDKVTAWTESAKAAMSAAQTADSKAQQADSKAQAADTAAQAVKTALEGLTKIQDGKVLIDGDKVYLSAAFVRSIFAQDITATGKIKSGNYNGTESAPLENTKGSILKMDDGTFNFAGGKLVYNGSSLVLDGKIKGEAIDIEGGDTTGKIRLYSEYVVNEKTGVREYPRFEIVAQGDTSESRVMATPPKLNLYSRSVGINAGIGGVELGGSFDSETGNYVTMIYLRGVTEITGGAAAINVDSNSVEITAGSQPDNADITPYVQIGKYGEEVHLSGDIYINNVRPYYTAGDTATIKRMYCAGGVTGSGTNLYFYIPLAKPLIGVSKVTISNPTKAIITARKVGGGYIAQDATVSSLGTPSCVPYENGVTIGIKASSAYNTTNNTPVTVTPENLVLKFT